ncbi:putative phosphatase phospho2 [Porphyridium purpureum]|uniref:Putative phosphatase phospho2 n=1 Tax=Porphyridium purpureum TaxID=35688 RepID=A0A5J4YWP0_PORPP|nr:putative phosphatase phospho2 [Porphyridium purpureum]|eukprot:POR5575..scf209_3
MINEKKNRVDAWSWSWWWWWWPWPQTTRVAARSDDFHEQDITARYQLDSSSLASAGGGSAGEFSRTSPKDQVSEWNRESEQLDAVLAPSLPSETQENASVYDLSEPDSETGRSPRVLDEPVGENSPSGQREGSETECALPVFNKHARPEVSLEEESNCAYEGSPDSAQKHGPYVLIVYDFDDTILDGNSDLVPTKRFYPRLMHFISEQVRNEQPWTDIMNATLRTLHRRGIGAGEICAAVADTPLVPGMQDLLQAARSSSLVAAQAIISDSNSIYINAVLTRNHLQDTVFDRKLIFTNSAQIHDEQLRIQAYADPKTETSFPARCSDCPANLCKGKVLEELLILQEQQLGHRPTVVYIGDGGNDLCPGTRLLACDYLCPRSGFKLAGRLASEPALCRATIVPWTSGSDLLQALTRCNLV